jgi:hypothetical protein
LEQRNSHRMYSVYVSEVGCTPKSWRISQGGGETPGVDVVVGSEVMVRRMGASVHVSALALSSARTQDRASSLSWIEALPTERGARRPEHSLLSSGDWHHLRSSYARISYASPMQSFGPSRRSSSHWYSSFSSCLSLFSSLFLLVLSFGRPLRFHGRSLSSCSMGASCYTFVLIAYTKPT